jgi:hypothetical protein
MVPTDLSVPMVTVEYTLPSASVTPVGAGVLLSSDLRFSLAFSRLIYYLQVESPNSTGKDL